MSAERPVPTLPSPADAAAVDLREFRRKQPFTDIDWRKVKAPQVWNPAVPTELIGYFHGRTVKSGQFGEYTVIQILVPGEGIYLVSGTALIQLIDSAAPDPGDPLKIVFRGRKQLPKRETDTVDERPHYKKMFDVFTAKGGAG